MPASRKAPIAFPFPDDLTDCRVGRFVIKSKLGGGGMGEVYYAQDTKLRRPVALKRVAARLGRDAEARRRILQEAQRASTLNSAHIASVHDVLEENGEVFIVMEYVEGETLRKRMTQRMPLGEFFSIMMQCTEALSAAHAQSIVHCDIKPENILITPDNKVKVLDFGVAKRIALAGDSSTIDASGPFGGTAGYIAPEVLLEGLPTARSDIFSLGVVMYEALTLCQPFAASNVVASSERVLHQDPPDIRHLRPDVPSGLAAVVMKAMAKHPEDRYASADELAQDLRNAQAGELSLLVTTELLLPSRLRGRKTWISLGLLAVVLLLAAGALLHWRSPPPTLAERGWVLITDFDTTGEVSIPQTAVREGLTIALQQSQYVNVFPRTRVYEVLERMRRAGARIDETLGREICQRENLQVLLAGNVERSGPVLQITVRGIDPARGNLLFAEQERFDKESQFFDKADLLAGRVRRDLGESLERIAKNTRPLARVTTSSLEALQLYSQAKDAVDRGKNEPVAELLKSALRLDPNFAMAHLELGQYYLAVVGKNDKAVAEHEQAYELRENVTDRERRRIEAGYYRLLEQYEAEQQSLAALVALYPDDEQAHLDLASAYYDLSQTDRAIAELHEALRLNPSSVRAYGNLVLFLAYRSTPREAISAFEEARRLGLDTPRLHWGLGLAYLGMDDIQRARREFGEIGQATETDRELRDLCLAVADLHIGKFRSAEARLAKQIAESSTEAGGLQTYTRYLQGRTYLAQARPEAAVEQADLILRVPRSGLQVTDLLDAGILYTRSGELGKARKILQTIDDSARRFPGSASRSSFHNLNGEILLAQGKLREAETEFVAAAQDFALALPHAGLARAYEMEQQWDAAAREWEQVLASSGQVLHNDFPADLSYAELHLGRLYGRMSQPELARKHYEKFLARWQQADDTALLTQAHHEVNELH